METSKHEPRANAYCEPETSTCITRRLKFEWISLTSFRQLYERRAQKVSSVGKRSSFFTCSKV